MVNNICSRCSTRFGYACMPQSFVGGYWESIKELQYVISWGDITRILLGSLFGRPLGNYTTTLHRSDKIAVSTFASTQQRDDTLHLRQFVKRI